MTQESSIDGLTQEERAARTCSHMKLVIYGSSVASGAGAEEGYGWAHRLSAVLEKRNWTVVNKSVGGDNTTRLLARFDRDLLPEKPDVVFIGLSLGNEGVIAAPLPTYVGYVRNLRKLIQLCRKHGMIPVVGGCYPNNAYGPIHTEVIRRVNAELNTWPVASIDFMGTVDDGAGHWQADCWKDGAHPNDRGHEEMFFAIPPSLFDALIDPGYALPSPEASWLRYAADPAAQNAPLHYQAVDPIHSFSLGFAVRFPTKPRGPAVIAAVDGHDLYVTREGGFGLRGAHGEALQSVGRVQADRRHHVAVTHSYVNHRTQLWVDGVAAGSLTEQLAPAEFRIGGGREGGGPDAFYKDVTLHRTCLDAAEVMHLANGGRLRSSLELYAPLTDQKFADGLPVINAAQTEARLYLTGTGCRCLARGC